MYDIHMLPKEKITKKFELMTTILEGLNVLSPFHMQM
jgi:hypothetical protein